MKDKEKQITEMPICVNCIHSYVCEEYNLNRDMLRKRCAYYNNHFLDIEQHDTKLRKETVEKILKWLTSKRHLFNRTHEVGFEKPRTSYLVLNDEIEELAKQYGIEIMVEIKE